MAVRAKVNRTGRPPARFVRITYDDEGPVKGKATPFQEKDLGIACVSPLRIRMFDRPC